MPKENDDYIKVLIKALNDFNSARSVGVAVICCLLCGDDEHCLRLVDESCETGWIFSSFIPVEGDVVCGQWLLLKIKWGRIQGFFYTLGRLQRQSNLSCFENKLLKICNWTISNRPIHATSFTNHWMMWLNGDDCPPYYS